MRPRTLALATAVVVAVVVALAVGVAVGRASRNPGAAPTSITSPPVPTLPPSTTESGVSDTGSVAVEDRTVQQGLLQRQYLVLSPGDVGAGERLPVVIVLHGLGFDRLAESKVTDWAGAVLRERFLAVFPQGVLNSWNAGPCCPPATLLGIDDVGFLDQVTAELRRRPDVDPARLHLAGFSNGGIMTYTMACARPGDFAAVAPMAGSNLSGCSPPSPVSLLHLHGDVDLVVPYDGGFTPSQLLSSADFPPVPDSVAAWAAANGCAAEPDVTEQPGPVVRTRWGRCGSGTEVELVTYPGNQHTWPTEPVDGLEELLRFFDIS
jgi:polyhydroxybutyrate depolymerase